MLFVRCCCAVTAVACAAAQGQTVIAQPGAASTTPKARYTVSGTVVNSVTGEPVRRALVSIRGPEQHFAMTGSDGRFQLEGVPEGPAIVIPQKPGFFDESSSPQPFAHAYPIVTVGPATGDLVLKLMPEAIIQGRIVDSEGEPVEGVGVQLVRLQIVNGRKQWQQTGGSSTNENGVYRIENLQPGTYLVRAGPHPALPNIQGGSGDGESSAQIYPPQYYPGAPDMASAQQIKLGAGEDFQTDFKLSPVRGSTVSGTAAGAPQNGLQIMIEDSEGQQVAGGWRFDSRTGKFVVLGIPPGAWRLVFRSNDAQGQTYYAEQMVDLSSANIANLRVQLQPLPSIPIHVVNAPDPATANVQVGLIDEKSKQQFSSFMQAHPGLFELRGVANGTYQVSARAWGNARCIDSITSGGTDLMRDSLTVSAGLPPQPIDVVLLDNCASLSGSVQDDGKPALGFVLLVSNLPMSQPVVLPIQMNGQFQYQNLRPGTYRLYAFSSLGDLEYADPEVLRDFAGQQIDLKAGETAQVTANLIHRENP